MKEVTVDVLRWNEAELKREYGILCRRVAPPEKAAPAPFGSSWCVVEPGGSTSPHHHFEGESFYLLEGRGQMEIDGEQREVSGGDVVFIPPFATHALRNASLTEPLRFLSVWWEPSGSTGTERLPRRALVTSAPPTPNGDLHVGHLSGPYLAADVVRRALSQRGVETVYLSGSDDHQSYVAAKAARLGLTPAQASTHYAERIQATLDSFEAKPDLFLRPATNAAYRAFVQAFFQKLVERGSLVPRASRAPFCESCDRYLYEVFVSGGCPHCGAPTNGNGCEACGHLNDCGNLVEPRCQQCRRPAGQRAFTRYFFPLEPWRETLQKFYAEVEMSPRLRALVGEALERGLPEVSATHVTEWGIACPISGFEEQVIYEWVEMAAGYLFATESPGGEAPALRKSGEARSFWKADDAEVIQCFGFDNGFFYAALIPALLAAYDAEVRLPRVFLSNEFYHLDGAKFSTSRNHAVWGDELLARVSPDAARLFLAYDRPENESTNFTRAALTQFVDEELGGVWGGWLASLDAKLAEECGRQSPELLTRALTPRAQVFLNRMTALAQHVGAAYLPRTFSLRTAARGLSSLVHEASEFGKAHEWLKTRPSLRNERRNAIALELAAARLLGHLAAPLMPRFGAKLTETISAEAPGWASGVSLVPAGHRLAPFGDLGLGWLKERAL